MPATYPSHQAAVLPLKLWRPRAVDGVALVVGSAAPDLAYVLDGITRPLGTHAWAAVLWWAVPVTLVCVRFVRVVAPAAAVHLPDGGRLALRDYGTLGGHRYRWWVTVLCGALGAASHIAWDSFTHAGIDGGTLLLPQLGRTVWPGMPLWHALQWISSAVGAGATAGMLLVIGSRRLLVAWHGQPPQLPRHPVAFWSTATATALVSCATLPLLPGSRGPHVIGTRLLVVAAVAAATGGLAAGFAARRAGPGQGTMG